ncbi:hypothetical protein DENSPDRAFT_842803 [Dentipellis sp. KUC8613]|nr:hypothetical protein DENSPDRAFT_842803 [Dentipellis sp. KUC8613]
MTTYQVNLARSLIPSASEYWQDSEKRRLLHVSASCGNPCPPGHSGVHDMRSVLALEMDAVKKVLSSLSIRYNSLSPANRLPSEILVHIFTFLQVADPPSVIEDDSHPTEYDIGWIYATHVCHHWRTVALEHSSLWSTIVLDLGSRWAAEFLRRSRMAPIAFRMVELGMTTGVDVAGTIKEHLGHIREFDIAARNAEEVHSFPLSLRGAAPELEKASLHSNFRHWSDTIPTATLPTDLFGRTAPRLRHLKITCFRFSWPTLAFQSMTHLDIKQDPRAPRLDAELRDFDHCLRALADMPALESIKLDHALPSLSPDVAVSFRTSVTSRTTLPNLHYLFLQDHVVECGLMLEYLVAPALLPTETRVSFMLDPAGGRGSTYILPWLAAQVRAWSGSTIRALNIYSYKKDLHLAAWDSYSLGKDKSPTVPEDPPSPAGKSLLELSFHGVTEGTSEVFAELQTICQLLPLDRLETLHISGCGRTCRTAQECITLFGNCQHVFHLEFTSFYERAFMKALQARIPLGTGNDILFPALTSVTFSEIEFTYEYKDVDERVVRWLYLRSLLMPLRRVYIRKSAMNREMRKRIGEKVSEIIWDEEDLNR